MLAMFVLGFVAGALVVLAWVLREMSKDLYRAHLRMCGDDEPQT